MELTSRLALACKILMEQCAHVKKGEELLIVSDDLQSGELELALRDAAVQVGAHPVLANYPALEPYREPPRTVLNAMKSAGVVIACATRPLASEAMEEALKAGARILSMFRITPDALCRTVDIDYSILAKRDDEDQKDPRRLEGHQDLFASRNRPSRSNGRQIDAACPRLGP